METSITKKKMRDKATIGKFIVFLLVVHFLFFGAIANIYEKETVGDNILFVYKNFYGASSWFTLFILILIFAGIAFSEDFLVDGVKNCLRIVPFMIIFSIMWYMINGFGNFDVVWYEKILNPFLEYFISWEGYLNIVILIIISVGSAILGGFLKVKTVEYRKSKRRIVE